MIQEKVFLKKKDFDVFRSDYTYNYCIIDDCPLARACKRHFKTKNVVVDACDSGVKINGEHWSNTDEWGCDIAEKVSICLHIDKDKTKYYVTLTKN